MVLNIEGHLRPFVRIGLDWIILLYFTIVYGSTTGAVPANQPVSGGEATDRRKSFRRKMADCPS